MTIKLVLAGCGNMGYAMLAGWVKSGKLKAAEVLVVEPADALRARAEALGCPAVADAADIAADVKPALVVLAVKPQVIREVTAAYAKFGNGGTTFLSVAAAALVCSVTSPCLELRTPVVATRSPPWPSFHPTLHFAFPPRFLVFPC